MKKFFGFIAFAMVIAFTTNAAAANQCSLLYRSIIEDASLRTLNSAKQAVEQLKSVEITETEKPEILRIVKSLRITDISDINNLANAMREKISPRAGDPLVRGSNYAKMAGKVFNVLESRIERFYSEKGYERESNKIYSLDKEELASLIREQNPRMTEARVKKLLDQQMAEYNDIKLELLRVKFAFAENITKLESFDISEYQDADSTPLNNAGYTIISLDEYPAFAMALAKNKQPPRPYGSGGVLSHEEYRNIVSSNMWLFTLQGHDLKHIHFANSHPMATASMFRNTRSKNHIRYVLLAGVYEGVDTVQYYFETQLARHFSEKGYSLEQAMLEIATMTTDDLNKLAQKVGVDANNFTNWRPSKLKRSVLPDNVSTPDQYENDIIRFMAKSLTDLMNPRINIYMRPELIPDGINVPAGTSMKPGEIIHHY